MLFRQTFGKGVGRPGHVLPWRRRRADEWLRAATGSEVPTAHAWRAAELTSPRRRHLLARTLGEVADARPRNDALGGRYRPRHTASVSRRESLEELAVALENENHLVAPAGMLSVLDLVTDGTGPLWGGNEQALDDALERIFAIVPVHSNVRIPESRAA
jgi:hypothetical protein